MSDPRVRPGCEAFSFDGGPIGVLMVHGFTGSPASMRPIGAWLSSQGIAVEGVRLPGHGTNVEDLRDRRWTEWVDTAVAGSTPWASERARSWRSGSRWAAVVLATVASRPHEVDGLAVTSPYVFDRRLLAAPVGGLVLRNARGVANDIAKRGQDERGDALKPVPSIRQMVAMMKLVRRALPKIHRPIVGFRSGTDHVIPRSNASKVLRRIGSERKALVECPNSCHVVTLDHDAPLVRERVLAFARELDAVKV